MTSDLEALKQLTGAGPSLYPTPEQRAEWDRRSREYILRLSQAKADAAICAHCGEAIAPQGPVWLGTIYYPGNCIVARCQAPLCAGCRNYLCRVSYEPFPRRCEGCSRDIYLQVTHRRRRYVACSEKCRKECCRKDALLQKEERKRNCVCCGREFLPPRSDARTCSPACRQRAYRRRVRLRRGTETTSSQP
jgi:hypothetical protein